MRTRGLIKESRTALQVPGETDLLQLACFAVGEERYGIDIMKVKEVTRYHPVTRLPRPHPFIEGVIDLRGAIVPVVDMRKRLDLPLLVPTKRTRIIIAVVKGKILGIIVDEAREVIRVPRTGVKPPPQFVANIEQDYLAGVIEHGDGLIFLLDFDRVFLMEEKMEVPRTKERGV